MLPSINPGFWVEILHSLLMELREQISWEPAHSWIHLFNCKCFLSPCGLPNTGFTVVNERGKAHKPVSPVRIPILLGPHAISGEGWGKRAVCKWIVNIPRVEPIHVMETEIVHSERLARRNVAFGGVVGVSSVTVGKDQHYRQRSADVKVPSHRQPACSKTETSLWLEQL